MVAIIYQIVGKINPLLQPASSAKAVPALFTAEQQPQSDQQQDNGEEGAQRGGCLGNQAVQLQQGGSSQKY